MTPQEFANRIRQKYPNGVSSDGRPYSQIDDVELTNKVIEKYPVYASQVKFEESTSQKGFLGNVANALGQRLQNVKSSFGEFTAGKQDPISTSLQIVGQGAGAVGDVAGQALIGAAKTAVKALPGQIEKPVIEATKKVGTEFLNTPLGQSALSAVRGGVETYNKFKAKYPIAARNLEAVLNIGSLLPISKSAQVTGKTLKTGTELAESFFKKEATKAFNRKQLKLLDQAIDIVQPSFTKKEAIGAFEKAGVPGGMQKVGILGKYKYTPNQYDVDVANSIKNTVSKSKGPLDNIVEINKKISNVAEKEITPFLSNNKVPFNFEDFINYTKRVTPEPSLQSQVDALPTYNRVVTRLTDEVANELRKTKNVDNLTDMGELWRARQKIDDIIQEELGSVTFDTPQYKGVRAAARDFRDTMNDFIADSIANPGQMENLIQIDNFIAQARKRGVDISNVAETKKALKKFYGLDNVPEQEIKAALFKSRIKDLSRAYEARARIAENNFRLMDKNAIQRWIKQNPNKWKTLKIAGGLIGLGTIGSSIGQ